MNNTILSLIQAGATVATFAFVYSWGLQTRAGDMRYLIGRPGLLLRSLLTVDLLVPLIALATVILIHPARNVAVGLLLLASSPAAPMVIKNIAKAGGNREYAVSLHVVLALLAVVTTPATLSLLAVITGIPLEVSRQAIAELVGITIIVPLAAGAITRWLFPALAERIQVPVRIFSNVIFITVVALVLLKTYQLLLMMDVMSYVAIALVTVGALAAGHLLATGKPDEQTTLALESATRNTGLALLIASTFAPLEQALPVLVPFIIASAIISLIYVMLRKMPARKTTGEIID